MICKKFPLILACVLGSLSCDDRKKDERWDQCVQVCLRILCNVSTAEGAVDACAEDCVDRHSEANDIGAPCTSAYSGLLDCLEPLECDDSRVWSVLKGEPEGYACVSETTAFNVACPGLWFDPK